MRSESYKYQDACINYKFCFIKKECDSNDEYYCSFGMPKRLICGSVLMSEAFDPWNKNNAIFRRQVEM